MSVNIQFNGVPLADWQSPIDAQFARDLARSFNKIGQNVSYRESTTTEARYELYSVHEDNAVIASLNPELTKATIVDADTSTVQQNQLDTMCQMYGWTFEKV